ncbi:MAG: dihydrolipoyl dehydrogenase [Firmicutes bacterium]|nr:dihydrolipoyl dehydrogenase [Bacillota bacterium]
MKKNTVVIIGGGIGGYVAAIRLAQLNAKVILIEKNKIGGTCLNIGCIPTKCLLHSADLLYQIKKHGEIIGLTEKDIRIDFSKVIAYKDEMIKKLCSGVEDLLETNKIEKISGKAAFISEKTLEVELNDGSTKMLEPDKIIIATGSKNQIPAIKGIKENPNCIDSTGVLSLERLPESMIIIGGGVIGMEMACAYATFGTRITIIDNMPRILPMMDKELTEIGMNNMKDMGIRFELETTVQSVEKSKVGVLLRCENKNGDNITFESEKVLVAVGREANTESLNLLKGDIDNDMGRILVNDKMETNVEGVYAIGDCVFGKAQLAHTASLMGEVAAENAMGGNILYNQLTNPTCVFINPEFAGVGLTEEQAIEKGLEYKVGKFPLSHNGKSLILNEGIGLVKIIAGKRYAEILGMHIIGPRASDLIAEGAIAISLEATIDEIINTIHSHPTVSEAIREAALHVEKRAIHTINK